MKNKIIKQFISFVLVFIMILSMVPLDVLAATSATDMVKSDDKIITSLIDGGTQLGSKLTFDVWAKDKDGKKIDSSVTFNEKSIPYTWNDESKTSYTLSFTKNGENIIVLTAGAATATYTIYYKPAKKGDVIGKAVVSVEAFTLGGGYLIEPILVDIKEGENAAQLLDGVLTEHGYTYNSTGSLTNGFYLATLYGGVLPFKANVPDILKKSLSKKSRFDEDEDIAESGLGEFDFTSGSGWMYCVNKMFPNVGFSDYYLSDGDVMRVQFTLALGTDIGGASAMGFSYANDYYDVADKDELTRLIAEKGIDNVDEEVLAIATKVNATQSEVNSAINVLKLKESFTEILQRFIITVMFK